MENRRYELRMNRSEFVRKAITAFIQTLTDEEQEERDEAEVQAAKNLGFLETWTPPAADPDLSDEIISHREEEERSWKEHKRLGPPEDNPSL